MKLASAVRSSDLLFDIFLSIVNKTIAINVTIFLLFALV
jgi:hypothetical protein